MNSELRRKNQTHKKQARTLLEEKSDLETKLHEKDAEVDHIKRQIGEHERFEEQRAAVRAAISSTKHIDGEEPVEVSNQCLYFSISYFVCHFYFLDCNK